MISMMMSDDDADGDAGDDDDNNNDDADDGDGDGDDVGEGMRDPVRERVAVTNGVRGGLGVIGRRGVEG